MNYGHITTSLKIVLFKKKLKKHFYMSKKGLFLWKMSFCSLKKFLVYPWKKKPFLYIRKKKWAFSMRISWLLERLRKRLWVLEKYFYKKKKVKKEKPHVFRKKNIFIHLRKTLFKIKIKAILKIGFCLKKHFSIIFLKRLWKWTHMVFVNILKKITKFNPFRTYFESIEDLKNSTMEGFTT